MQCLCVSDEGREDGMRDHQLIPDDGETADAARRIASWTEGQPRINVYRVAKVELSAALSSARKQAIEEAARVAEGCFMHLTDAQSCAVHQIEARAAIAQAIRNLLQEDDNAAV